MENSFFEYRDKTEADSGSDSEIIDDSMVLENVPYSAKKKNRTVFIPESDDSISNDDETKDSFGAENVSKSIARRSSAAGRHVIDSSEDDGSKGDSLTSRQNNVIVSSSDEGDYSPELIPKRCPPTRQKPINSNESLVLQRTKKRMLFQDSDTDNSIIIEQRKNNKLKCLKETPLKIEGSKINNVDKSMDDESCDGDDDEYDDDDDDESDDENDNDDSEHHSISSLGKQSKKLTIGNDQSGNECDDPIGNSIKTSKNKLVISSDDDDGNNSEHQTSTKKTKKTKKLIISSDDDDDDGDIISKMKKTDISFDSPKSLHDYCNDNASKKSDDNAENDYDDDDEGPDEDFMVMSRATRMSIMGVIPKDNDSGDSDFIQSDSSSRKAGESITGSLENLQNVGSKSGLEYTKKTLEKTDDDLPEATINQTQAIQTSEKEKEISFSESIHSDDSKISCSPFSSPLQDITNKSAEESRKLKLNAGKKLTGYMDLTIVPDMPKVKEVIDLSNVEPSGARNKVLNNSASLLRQNAFKNYDDVTIIDTMPEIIALSSDDDDQQAKADKNARAPKVKSPLVDTTKIQPQESMIQHLAPSRPGQVVYVKKHVKENELKKLMGLKEDLNNVRTLLGEMDLESLPDGGTRLVARHRALEAEVRRQGDRVANMVVEPDQPTAADIAADGFDTGLSWDAIQKGSNAVQPRMFGRQAMATHMAERNLIVDRLRDLHAALGSRPNEASQAAAPRLLRSTLMPYQRHALAWLQWRETQKPASGILADDMGLGKTISMISLIASDKQDKIDHEDDDDESTARDKLVRGGTLVVCPASLIQQWAGEVSKHCSPHALSVCLHHGASRAAQPHRLAAHDMVATTYNILQRDSDKNGVLMRIQWRRIILDEAHIVRNHKSATSTAVSRLRGARRWCLTGTPVQNKDLDLFALLKFLRLSPFDDLQMWKKWIDNKSQGGQERLNIIMQCILLRRTKVQLQEKGELQCLPTRTAHTREVTLTSDEMNVYQKVLVLSKTLFAQFLHQRAEKNSGTTFTAAGNSEYDKMHKRMVALQGVKPVKSHEILVLLLRLRQVCCHCGLIGGMLDDAAPGAEPEEAGADLLRELDKLSLEESRRKSNSNQPDSAEEPVVEASAKADEAIRAVMAPHHPVFQLSRPSSKIAAVMDCLQEHVFNNKGDKAVVVSQWTSVLNLVEKELNKKKIRSVTLSGAVPVPARPRLIDLVNDPKSDVKVMLLSLCAGGVGINLCGANHLLLLDPHWNPQLEQQAQDRIYRLGQNKPVHIYRFVCVDTVEQTIRKLQEAKLLLADNVLTGAGNKAGSPLSVEELKMLFNMGT